MVRKVVLTGGSGAGKSSVLNLIENKGHRVEHEVAKEVITELRQQGHRYPHRENRDAFQREVVRRQLNREEKISNLNGTVFFDRGIIDNIAYYRKDGIEPPLYLRSLANSVKYDLVFYLELVPLNKLQNRILKDEERIRTGPLILEEYVRYGYAPIKIPELNLDERANIILKMAGL